MPMHLEDLLSADRVALDQPLSSKKSLLEKAAELLALDPESAEDRDIFEGLCQRERLGSTGLGHGVAIPHCRVDQDSVTGALIRLRRPIDFDSPDSEKVDLFFALSVPSQCSEAHLKLLGSIAELFSHPEQREKLRRVSGYDELREVLSGEPADETL
ncbi:MAG: PTS sugar transporter subunit IIA [Wenzhouxiangellaceae bacterium]